MYRNNEELIAANHRDHNFVLNHGALGDAICSLPAIAYARQNRHRNVTMRVWCSAHQMELFGHLLAPYGEFEMKDIKGFPGKAADRKAMGFGPLSHNAPFYDTHTRNSVHMVDYAYNFLIDRGCDNQHERSYPTAAPVGAPFIESMPYVAFQIGHTSENKAFRAEVMRPIIEWVIERGLKPVLLGTTVNHTKIRDDDGVLIPLAIVNEIHKLPISLMEQCIDLRDKTTLMEARRVLGHAACVVGIDGGLIHLAGTTDAPIIYGLTTTLPRHRYIPRHGDPFYKIRYVGPRDLECAGCQSNWTLTYFDFRQCAYGDNKCTYQMHPDDFIAGMQDLGL